MVGPGVGVGGRWHQREGTRMFSLHTRCPSPVQNPALEVPPSCHGLQGERVGLAAGRECGFVLGEQRTELGACFSWGWGLGWGQAERLLTGPEAELQGWVWQEQAVPRGTREDPRALQG